MACVLGPDEEYSQIKTFAYALKGVDNDVICDINGRLRGNIPMQFWFSLDDKLQDLKCL